MKTEVNNANKWLERRGLTLDKLAELTGYARPTLYWYFRGLTPPKRPKKSQPIADPEWRRFKTLCAGIDSQIERGKAFDW